MRPSQRATDQLRPVRLTRHYTKYAEGSVLVEFGDTKVLCTATISDGVPRFLKDNGQGWLTAEYGMLPRSTHDRMEREASRGKQQGRTVEIQRLIGRALRAAVDLSAIGERTITIDCDVIQADGGTRTAAITGGCVALVDALNHLSKKFTLIKKPLKQWISAISVGVYQGTPVLDLDYAEDSNCDTDMNVVMSEHGGFIEIQGTAEGDSFHDQQLQQLIALAQKGNRELIELQRQAISNS